MHILSVLEELATNTPYRVDVNKLISNQPIEIKEAFKTKNSAQLKKQLGSTVNLADKSLVVQIVRA